MAADGGFSPVAAGERAAAVASGPSSNTGQKGGALIDFITLVVPMAFVAELGLSRIDDLVGHIFGLRVGEGDTLRCTPLREKRWQFYQLSALIYDRDGEQAGRVGVGGNRDTVCISLSGTGTRWVRNWAGVAARLERLKGRVSRLDLAWDDYQGERFDVHRMRDLARAGQFAEGGRPPNTAFLDDHGSGKGCTLYVGAKGHKQLCIYEKGKQLGDPASPWVRCEVRLYGKHTVVPLASLLAPLDYLRGAYEMLGVILADSPEDACTRIKTTRTAAEASAVAMIESTRRQCGRAVGLLRDALGADWAEFIATEIAREGSPARFRSIASGPQLIQLIKEQLQCHAST